MGDRSSAQERSSSHQRRRDAKDLGWWRATVRTSLESAEHCHAVCCHIDSLLLGCRRLVGSLPSLRSLDPALLRNAEAFVELRGGAMGGGAMAAAELLDLRRRAEVHVRLQEAEECLRPLLAQAEVLDGEGGEGGASPATASASTVPASALPSSSGGGGVGEQAEVLTLAPPLPPRPATCGELQEDISSLREELRLFGSQLENLGGLVSRRTPGGGRRPCTAGSFDFSPPIRDSGSGGGSGADDVATDVDADAAAALEVARRSSWYKEPPPVLADDVQLIEVRSDIALRKITRCPSRPRTSHPKLLVTSLPPRPSTAPAPAAPPSPSSARGGPAAAASRPGPGGEDREEEDVVAEEGEGEAEEQEAQEEDGEAGDGDPFFSGLGVSWRIS